ncbi:glycosyl hydrolase 115 family protein [Luteimonas sp. RD2P54]|uniref:Glycosyl hydrolase 115 family protein n=1 Tax=Luteimonas endophytica TaxID=3042023 RepID=A0ABT6J8W3_9GAMM|nr:glycosyl hydrolase 115 family protein [Luteimonas endophytica]MDH5823262.1 glycosyl hydrolase 115 family protein [Luteimonas endophytica]
MSAVATPDPCPGKRDGGARRRRRAATIALALLLAVGAAPATAAECARPAAVCERAVAGALPLVDDGAPATVLADEADFPGVLRAARDLQADLSAVAGAEAAFSTTAAAAGRSAIIVGTLGRSPRVDRIVRAQGIDTGDVAGRWEAYLVQVVEDPEPGIERALLIAGADRRGTIFGIYELSRRIGVSPWSWWADVPPRRAASLHAAPGRFVDAPGVKYRGIFINDEDPALGGWIRETYGSANHRFYERVFQLILRHKANYLWPAMWVPRAFYDDDPRNAELADEMGVVVATTHHEPMMRAHAEWETYGEGPWDYTRNPARLQEFWRGGIERLQGREALVTLGMRGDGDEAMTEGTAIELLERIVADQRAIIADVTGRPAAETPQVWALYKEVQDYFDQGMRVPEDVTLLFADDNWGNVRRLPEPGAARPGSYGVYYHFDYVGGPRNYKWLNTTQLERAWEQMRLAWAHGVERMWIVNVGDIKPMELPISAFLDQAWNPDAADLAWISNYPEHWAAEQFGRAHAREIGEILTRYTQYNARRKPELLSPDTWSLLHDGEAERVIDDWDALEARTLALGERLPARHRDAWYQLVEYPVLASANLNRLYVAAARNRLYAAQGRASANRWADQTRRLFARDAELQRVYEREVAGGKWIHMMSQPRIGYTHWQQPERNVLPALAEVDVPTRGVTGVAVEGDARPWPQRAASPRLAPLDPVGAPTREVVVYNRGASPLGFNARSSQPWLRVSPARAEVEDAQPLELAVDWAELPEGEHEAVVAILGSDRTEVYVQVPVRKPPAHRGARGFVEGDGVVAIEAAHHARAVPPPGGEWQVIPNLGRTLSGVTVWPATGAALAPGGDGARLEYPLVMDAAGEVEVRVVLSPTLDFRNRGGLRYAVSVDDEPPQLVNVRLDPTPGDRDFRAWEHAVIDSVHVAISRHHVAPGANTLKLWAVDPGLVFQRIEVVADPRPRGTLGPVESRRR